MTSVRVTRDGGSPALSFGDGRKLADPRLRQRNSITGGALRRGGDRFGGESGSFSAVTSLRGRCRGRHPPTPQKKDAAIARGVLRDSLREVPGVGRPSLIRGATIRSFPRPPSSLGSHFGWSRDFAFPAVDDAFAAAEISAPPIVSLSVTVSDHGRTATSWSTSSLSYRSRDYSHDTSRSGSSGVPTTTSSWPEPWRALCRRTSRPESWTSGSSRQLHPF